MHEPPQTRPSLLVRIRDGRDADAWRQFVELYVPLIYRFARKCGLQDADAADVTQEVLRAVARSCRGLDYDPRRGTFRAWLLTVVRSKLANFRARRSRHEQPAGDSDARALLDELPAREEVSTLWDREYARHLFTWAAEQVRGGFEASSWQAFWQTAVEGKGAKEVAAALGLSVGAVYIAKSRVLARLREQLQQVQDVEPQATPGPRAAPRGSGKNLQ
jgi:RNA polymerase sigma-70 factor (ECF subfamily)